MRPGMTCSCRKLLLILTNQYRAVSVARTLIEANVRERMSRTWTMSSEPSVPASWRATSGGMCASGDPWER